MTLGLQKGGYKSTRLLPRPVEPLLFSHSVKSCYLRPACERPQGEGGREGRSARGGPAALPPLSAITRETPSRSYRLGLPIPRTTRDSHYCPFKPLCFGVIFTQQQIIGLAAQHSVWRDWLRRLSTQEAPVLSSRVLCSQQTSLIHHSNSPRPHSLRFLFSQKSRQSRQIEQS